MTEGRGRRVLVFVLGWAAVLGGGWAWITFEPRISALSDAERASAVAPEARAEFELVSQDFVTGTSKCYSRGDLLPLGDRKAMSEGDFIGRLRALFGPVPGDEYVLRDRATGAIVTAYSMQSGPSYGCGPVLAKGAKPLSAREGFAAMYEGSAARKKRLDADPVIAKGASVDWSKIDLRSASPTEVTALRAKEHTWFNHFEDVAAPPAAAAAIARLDALVERVRPADFEATRYYADTATVYQVGASGGVAFEHDLGPEPGLARLLDADEGKRRPVVVSSGDPFGPGGVVLDFWRDQASHGHPLPGLLPRVRKAWFRHAEWVRTEIPSIRRVFLGPAQDDAKTLGIDPARARAALGIK